MATTSVDILVTVPSEAHHRDHPADTDSMVSVDNTAIYDGVEPVNNDNTAISPATSLVFADGTPPSKPTVPEKDPNIFAKKALRESLFGLILAVVCMFTNYWTTADDNSGLFDCDKSLEVICGDDLATAQGLIISGVAIVALADVLICALLWMEQNSTWNQPMVAAVILLIGGLVFTVGLIVFDGNMIVAETAVFLGVDYSAITHASFSNYLSYLSAFCFVFAGFTLCR